MPRVLAGLIAILAGIAATMGGLWLWVGGSEGGADSFGWAMILGLFAVPIVVMAMAFGLLFLEGLANWLKQPRVPVLLWGGLLIPLGLAVVLAGPYLIGAAAGFDGARHSVVPTLLTAVAAIAPCFVTCAIYALLSNRTRDA